MGGDTVQPSTPCVLRGPELGTSLEGLRSHSRWLCSWLWFSQGISRDTQPVSEGNDTAHLEQSTRGRSMPSPPRMCQVRYFDMRKAVMQGLGQGFCPRSPSDTWCPEFLLGAGHVGTFCLSSCSSSDLQKEGRCSP